MIGRLKLFALALLALLLASAPALAGGNANFVLGGRSMTDNLWDPLDNQGMFGVTVDFGKKEWPVNLEAGVFGSADDDKLFGADFTGTVSELSFGVNKTWSPHKNLHPYIGGGLNNVKAELEVDFGGPSTSEHDTSIGFYAHGGLFWRLGSRFNIGGDVRLVRGTDIELFGTKIDADYDQAAILLGWGWPASK